jgi:hypothetical protein
VTVELTFHKADTVKRRVMFALELIDPGRGVSAGDQMKVTAEGFRAPRVTSAGQYVWTDVDPPTARDVKVEATAVRDWFKTYSATIAVPARADGVRIHVERAVLEPTGLYEPPAGKLAAAGMLIDTVQARTPLEGVTVELALRDSVGTILISTLRAKTDSRGSFVAMASDPGNAVPMPAPPPATEGSLVGWLRFTRQGAVRHSALLPLRQGRLLRVADPLVWNDLSATEPPPPP